MSGNRCTRGQICWPWCTQQIIGSAFGPNLAFQHLFKFTFGLSSQLKISIRAQFLARRLVVLRVLKHEQVEQKSTSYTVNFLCLPRYSCRHILIIYYRNYYIRDVCVCARSKVAFLKNTKNLTSIGKVKCTGYHPY